MPYWHLKRQSFSIRDLSQRRPGFASPAKAILRVADCGNDGALGFFEGSWHMSSGKTVARRTRCCPGTIRDPKFVMSGYGEAFEKARCHTPRYELTPVVTQSDFSQARQIGQ